MYEKRRMERIEQFIGTVTHLDRFCLDTRCYKSFGRTRNEYIVRKLTSKAAASLMQTCIFVPAKPKGDSSNHDLSAAFIARPSVNAESVALN